MKNGLKILTQVIAVGVCLLTLVMVVWTMEAGELPADPQPNGIPSVDSTYQP